MERKKKKAPPRLSSKGQKTSKGPTVTVKPSLPFHDEMKQLKTGQYVVGIGASAGGLEALELFFSHMPADSGMAFVLVPHLSPEHKSIMAELLKRYTSMKIAKPEMAWRSDRTACTSSPRTGTCPSGRHSPFARTLGLPRHPPSHRLLFPVPCPGPGRPVVCVILSGTGTEGTLGLRAIKGEGGLVLAQDVKDAKYDGMPASAIATGLVDHVLAASAMPELLLQYTKSRTRAACSLTAGRAGRRGPPEDSFRSSGPDGPRFHALQAEHDHTQDPQAHGDPPDRVPRQLRRLSSQQSPRDRLPLQSSSLSGSRAFSATPRPSIS